MSDLETALSEAHRLHDDLRAGKLSAYLDLHRILAAYGLHAVDLGTSYVALRGLWRDGILREAACAFEELKRGDRNQYAEVVKTLAIVGAAPEDIGTSHDELRSLRRKASVIAAQECRERLSGGDALAYDELLDHLALLDADPETLGLTLQDMRDARAAAMRARGLSDAPPPRSAA